LEWSNGKIIWNDQKQSLITTGLEGKLRFVGPKTDFKLSGSLEQLIPIYVVYSSFRQNWTAQVQIHNASLKPLLPVLEHRYGKSFQQRWPWLRSTVFSLTAKSQGTGRIIPQTSVHLLSQIELPNSKEEITLEGKIQPFLKPAEADLELHLNDLNIHRLHPDLEGALNGVLHLQGLLTTPTVKGTFEFSKGGQWKSLVWEKAFIKGQWIRDHLELDQGEANVAGGKFTFKGFGSPEQLDFRISADDLSLDELGKQQNSNSLLGSLALAATLKGTLKQPHLVGSFWGHEVAWAQGIPEMIRGTLDFSNDLLSLRATSDDQAFRSSADISHDGQEWHWENAEVHLRKGTTFRSSGKFNNQNQNVGASFTGEHIDLGAFAPDMTLSVGVQGPTHDLKITAKGTDEGLSMEASITKLQSQGTFHWSKFGIEGQASLHAGAYQSQLWPIQAEGYFKTTGNDNVYIPLTAKGEIYPNKKWSGDAFVEASTLRFAKRDTYPVQTNIHWDLKTFSWTQMHWTNAITSEGFIRYAKSGAIWGGNIALNKASLLQWAPIFQPSHSADWKGAISGHVTLSGPINQHTLNAEFHLDDGQWKEVPFQVNGEADWKRGVPLAVMLDSLVASGRSLFKGQMDISSHTAIGTLTMEKMKLETFGKSMKLPRSLNGEVQGQFQLSGPWAHLALQGQLHGDSITYSVEQNPLIWKTADVDFLLKVADELSGKTRILIKQAVGKTLEEECRLRPDSFIEFDADRHAHFEVKTDVRNLHLGLFTLFGATDILGEWTIQPDGFQVTGEAYTRSLFINDYELEEGRVHVEYDHGVFNFTPIRNNPVLATGRLDIRQAPQLIFDHFSIHGQNREKLEMDGQVGPDEWNFTVHGEDVELGLLSDLAGLTYPIAGKGSITAKAVGTLKDPHVEGSLTLGKGKAMGLAFGSGEAQFLWQGNAMTVTELKHSDSGRYTVIGTGVFPIKKTNDSIDNTVPINFSVKLLNTNLGILQSYIPEIKKAKGSVEGLFQITGDAAKPQMRGTLRVTDGSVDNGRYFQKLRHFNLLAQFDGNDLNIQTLQGQSGKGQFVGGGHINILSGTPTAYDLFLEVVGNKPVDIMIPELAIPEGPLAKRFKFFTSSSYGKITGKATFKGPADHPTFAAQVVLSDGHFTFPASSKQPTSPAVKEWLSRMTWDVLLRFTDGAWFENELLQANLLGQLKIIGPSDKLRVDGGMDIASGRMSYLGIEFDIREARFDMRSAQTDDGIVNTPYLRGIGESHIQTVDKISGLSVDDTITLMIDYAPVAEIKPRLVSATDPSLTQDKVLNRATQLEVENLTPQERNNLYAQQMVRLIDTSLATPLAQNILRKTGLVDELQVSRVIDPAAPENLQQTGTTPNRNNTANLFAGTKYTFSKNLSDRLALGYGIRFEQTTTTDLENKLDLRSDVQLSYRLLSNLYLKGSFDLPSQNPSLIPERKVTIEPRIRFGWWGNTNKTKAKPLKE